MLKPGIWPPNKPRATESHAEMAVYEALSKQLPKGWYAWHSLRIRIPGHADAEADFIIVDPTGGILILEVKGGHIEECDGMWFSNGKLLKHAPREQANHFMHELLRLLQSKGIDPPACGIATCFPDTEFNREPSQGDMSGCVLGAQDLLWLDKALPEVMDNALAKGYRPKGRWLQAIHELWGETWVPKMDFGLKARLEKEERIRLDSEQFTVLQGLMDNESVLVSGAAGTGKTVIAVALARKLAESGRKVLMLCFTESLAGWMWEQVNMPNLEVWAIKRYAVELLRQANKNVQIDDTPEFWSRIVLEALVEALPMLSFDWDAIIVDEGQDLIDDDWILVEELTRGKIRWAFCDPGQSFWPDRQIRASLFRTRYQLQRKYRCPEAVQKLAQFYLADPTECISPMSLDPEIVGIRPCPAAGTVTERIANEIDRLKSSGLENSDIAVLSLRGAAEQGSIVHQEQIGVHRIVRAHDPAARSNVVAETFLRFKGLERPAIIITDIGLAHEKQDYRKRMYIALTRTLSLVRIIDSRSILIQDPILTPLC